MKLNTIANYCSSKITDHWVYISNATSPRIFQLFVSQGASSWFSDSGFPRLADFLRPPQSNRSPTARDPGFLSSTRFVTAQRLAALIMHILYPEKRIRPLTLLRTQLYREHVPSSFDNSPSRRNSTRNLSSLNTHTNVCHPTSCPSVFDKRFLSPSPSRESCASHARWKAPPPPSGRAVFGLISIFFFPFFTLPAWPDDARGRTMRLLIYLNTGHPVLSREDLCMPPS